MNLGAMKTTHPQKRFSEHATSKNTNSDSNMQKSKVFLILSSASVVLILTYTMYNLRCECPQSSMPANTAPNTPAQT